MQLDRMLNLFYAEPDADRWMPLDRYPRKLIRRWLRGKPRVGGQQRVFLNLCAGLDALGIKYSVNDYKYIVRHPEEVACIIGKPHVLDTIPWKNPILFGAAIYSHPLVDLNLLERLPVRKVLVPGEWMRKMYEPYYGDVVAAWPVGIDTEIWQPTVVDSKTTDILIYDKVRWHHDDFEKSLIQPIREELKRRGLSSQEIRYGYYDEENFRQLLKKSKAMIFLCEHETQGIAYQQALSCGVPILAWDRGGCWRDPEFYPERVNFEPVSSVPYWDERCGVKFADTSEFKAQLEEFWQRVQVGTFSPRDYILETLTLEKCAQNYVDLFNAVQ